MSSEILGVAEDYCDAFVKADFERLAGLIDPQDRVDFQRENLKALSLLQEAGFAVGLHDKFANRPISQLSALSPEAFLSLFLSQLLGEMDGLTMRVLAVRSLGESEAEVDYQVETFSSQMRMRLAPYGWKVRLRDDLSAFAEMVRKVTEDFLSRARLDRSVAEDEALIPYQLCGYQDVHGETVIEARFEQAELFQNGRAAVKMMDRWGYIDHTGRIVIPVQYLQVTAFGEDRAFVSQVDEAYRRRWAMIDHDGRELTGFDYDDVSEFWNGRAGASNLDGLWGFLDREGRWAIPPAYLQVRPFYDESAWALHPERGEIYLAPDGREVEPPELVAPSDDDEPPLILERD